MKPKDSDTFIDIGVSITRLLLIASGQGTAASLIGEGAGLLRNLGSGGQRAISAEKIAADVAARLPQESWDISEADWHAAATHVAPLIDRLSEKDRLAAGYDWTALRPVLLDLGGEERRRKLADESAKRAFDWVLDVACQHITDCFTQEEALASLLKKVNEDCARLQRIERLLDRPGVQETSVVINDHIEVLRHLVPDALVDREQELADLEAFVRNSGGVWYAMEADMVSGKTTVMASFALNPPDDVHMASFFIRRIGGDGNDRGRFAFVMGAQLAKILGHEYTEPVRDPAQHTEFRQLLRRAATACRSETTPRPLVLLIDGIDEDSYFENPDGADAKSILSLLPRRLPEGVKIITASRPNPRLPEDVLCDENRRIVPLKPSPIAEKSINRKDMKIFFKSDVAVDIGAFLAACGGVLTVEDLRTLLIMRGHQRTLTWDVRAYVNRSPGRILTPIDVGFSGQEVLAYRLGHDVVTRAVIRELDPDSFGEGDEPEDERWWVPIREKALAPYRAIIRNWVKECAKKGWSNITSGYMLSRACFNLMVADGSIDEPLIKMIINQGRYKEMWCRSKQRYAVLQAIDEEFLAVLEMECAGCSQTIVEVLYGTAEFRNSFARSSVYISGLLTLYFSSFDTASEVVVGMALAIDEPEDRLRAFEEVMNVKFEGDHVLLTFLPVMVESVASYREVRDVTFRFLVKVFVDVANSASRRGSGCSDNNFVLWKTVLNDIKSLGSFLGTEEVVREFRRSIEYNGGRDENSRKIEFLLTVAETVVGQIKDSNTRAQALGDVAGALAGAGLVDRALDAAGQIENSWQRAETLAGIAEVLAGVGLVDRALDAAGQIENSNTRAQALRDVAGALAGAGLVDRALDAAGQIENPRQRAQVLADVARMLAGASLAGQVFDATGCVEEFGRRAWVLSGIAEALASAGLADRALNAAERIKDTRQRAQVLADVAKLLVWAGLMDAFKAAGRIKDPWQRAWALVGVAEALASAGLADRALEAAEEAARATERIENPRQRARVLVSVAGVLVGVGLVDWAFDAVEEAARAAGRIEDTWERAKALAGVAGALAGAGLVDWAFDAVEEAARAAGRIEDTWERANALISIVKVLVEAGLANQALNAAEPIEEFGRRARVLAGITEALARTSVRIEDPLGLAGALAGIVKVLVEAGQADQALDAAGQIENFWTRARVLVGIAEALVEAGQADQALDAAGRIEDPRQRARVLVGIAEALVEAGQADQALETVEEAVSVAGRIENSWTRVRVLVGIAEALAGAGLADRALETAGRIGDPWEREEVLAGVAEVLVGAGLADRALEAAGRIEDPRQRAEALVGIAKALAGAGLVGADLADRTLETAGRIEDPWERAKALAGIAEALVGIAEALAGVGLADRALEAAGRIEYPRQRAEALVGIAKSLVGVGLADRALEAAEEAARAAGRIEYTWERARVLVGVAEVLVGVGLVDRALEAAGRIGDPWERAEVLAGVAEVLVGAGLVDRALEAAEEAVHAAERVTPWERARTLADIAEVLVGAGLVDRALEAAERIKDTREHAWALVGIAKALVKAGTIGKALEIAKTISVPGPRGRGQSEVIKALVRKNSSDAATKTLRAEFAWARGIARRQDAADYCATLAAACVDAADLVDAESTTHERWLGLARSALARSWLYGAPVWNRFDVLLRVAPDLATRLVEERLLADPEPRPGSDPDPDPEGPGGGAPSSR